MKMKMMMNILLWLIMSSVLGGLAASGRNVWRMELQAEMAGAQYIEGTHRDLVELGSSRSAGVTQVVEGTQLASGSKWGVYSAMIAGGVIVAGVGVMVMVVFPAVAVCAVRALGFTAQGIAMGSRAAFMMSLYGGRVAAGSVVAVCQSVGALGVAGVSACGLVLVAIVMGVMTGIWAVLRVCGQLVLGVLAASCKVLSICGTLLLVAITTCGPLILCLLAVLGVAALLFFVLLPKLCRRTSPSDVQIWNHICDSLLTSSANSIPQLLDHFLAYAHNLLTQIWTTGTFDHPF